MPRFALVFAACLTGCALLRAPIVDDPGLDAGPLDDVPGLDAPRPDTPAEDAPLPPSDGSDCAASDTTCDALDDDCNGIVDDGGCSIGATCVAFTVGGVAYQSCPRISGIEAWSGACRRMGPGYELASFGDERDQDLVRDRLASLSAGPHWVAANDFDKSGEYVWWDGSPTPMLTFGGNPSDDPSHRCVAFGDDGIYLEDNCDDMQRVLCAADPAARRCVPVEEIPCNAIDDDCDGDVDEGSDCGHGCTSPTTFWTHVYYACTGTRRGDDEAPAQCDTIGGAQLSTVNNSTELSVLGDRITGESWVALSQPDGGSTPNMGWRWPDTGVTFGADAMVGVYPWSANEPNDRNGSENNEENCGLINAADRFDDRDCDDRLNFICENTWSFPPG